MFLQKPCFVCFHHTGPVHDCVLLIGRWSQQLCTPTHPWAAIETGLVSRTFVRNCPFCPTSHVKTITWNILPFIISTPWATLRTCVLYVPYTSNWSKCFMLNWISQKPTMFSERCMYIYQIGIFSPESHQHKSNCENLNSNRKGEQANVTQQKQNHKILELKG